MLLALDVGNTNTVLGLYEADRLLADWRITTERAQTADEYGVLFRNLFAMRGMDAAAVDSIIVSSVVPPLDTTLRRVCETYFRIAPLFVEPGIKTGMPLLIDNPAELGADRVANCVAAYARYGGPVVVVDFGTATTFDVVSARGEFLGGAIAPGLGISADALFARAARLARVDVKRPARAIGTSTVANLQSGLFFGYLGLVDGILEHILSEMKEQVKAGAPAVVVATGGLAALIAPESRFIAESNAMLTLDGLRLIYEKNLEMPRDKAVRKSRAVKTS